MYVKDRKLKKMIGKTEEHDMKFLPIHKQPVNKETLKIPLIKGFE